MINLFKTSQLFYNIKSDLAQLETLLYDTVRSPMELITEIGHHLIGSGGKRIRPALYLLTARAGSPNPEKLLPLAMALELIHTASLVHDDVLDNALTRRGSATANAKWGNNIAVLTGDYIFAKAFKAIASQDYGVRISELLAQIVCDLSEGEILQNHYAYQIPDSLDIYYDRIAKKTANFLAVSCEMGAILGNLPDEDIPAMREYGYCIGMAFQIVDDILDVTSNSQTIGKPAGNDILQGVITIPFIYTYLHTSIGPQLKGLIENKNITEVDVAQAIELIKASGGIEFAQSEVHRFLQRADEVLPTSLPKEYRKAFHEITKFIGERKY